MVILLTVLVVLLIVTAVISWMLAGYSMGIRRQTLEEARQWQESRYDLSWYDALEKRDYTVSADDGYCLHVQHIVQPEPSGRFVIISHGYTDNRFGALKYAKTYLDMGFDVIVYDLRGHGLNEPTFCSYSIRESADLMSLIRDTKERWPDLKILGLHGESLGAASTVACLKYRPGVSFAVSDCAFSEIKNVMKVGIRGMHLPTFLVDTASLAAGLRYGYRYEQMRPIDSLAGDHTPILFLHGAEDHFIVPANSEAMRDAAKDHSELRLIPGAGHAESALKQPQMYREIVTDFVGRVLGK